MKTGEMVGCLILGIALAGCGSGSAWTSEDSWYDPPPSGVLNGLGEQLDRERIHGVLETREQEAEALLEGVALLELTGAQATEFIGEPLPDVPGTKAYLTRGLYLSKGTGSFSVTLYDGQLVVSHRSLGSGGYPMSRQALVLQLEREPEQVYITCSMVQ